MDLGPPISYEVLEQGTPVLSSDHEQIGTVAHVLAVEDEDVFDGVVIAEHHEPGGHRFADADEIAEIHENAVVLKLNSKACDELPRPSANPGVVRVDPATTRSDLRHAKLKRAWDLLSGNY